MLVGVLRQILFDVSGVDLRGKGLFHPLKSEFPRDGLFLEGADKDCHIRGFLDGGFDEVDVAFVQRQKLPNDDCPFV